MSVQICDNMIHNTSNNREYKRERKHNAQSLPPGLSHEMMKKYVVYYREMFDSNGKTRTREYFKVEGHPKLLKVSIKPWISTKSGKVCLADKLSDANNVVTDLEDNIYPSSHYIDPTTSIDPQSLEHSILTDQKDINFNMNEKVKSWTKLLPKYVSIRDVREISDSSIKCIMTFDKKDRMNSYRWSMSHRFVLQTQLINNTNFIVVELEKLRKKVIEKYEMDIMSIA